MFTLITAIALGICAAVVEIAIVTNLPQMLSQWIMKSKLISIGFSLALGAGLGHVFGAMGIALLGAMFCTGITIYYYRFYMWRERYRAKRAQALKDAEQNPEGVYSEVCSS